MSSNEKYLELVKKKVMGDQGSKWLDQFKEAGPSEQYKLLNIMQESFPVKPSRAHGEKEELPQSVKDKQRLELIKKQYKKA